MIEGKEELIKYITNFYKELFGQPEITTINLNMQEALGITEEQAKTLIEPFSMQELYEVAFSMEKIKALGLITN